MLHQRTKVPRKVHRNFFNKARLFIDFNALIEKSKVICGGLIEILRDKEGSHKSLIIQTTLKSLPMKKIENNILFIS